jgi:hypothetical protein
MGPREAAVLMAQAAQGRRDPGYRGIDGGHRRVPGIGQKLRHPGQQDEDLQQVFGIARGDAALRVDLARAFAHQGIERRFKLLFHADKRAGRIDEPCQRLEPCKAGGCMLPAGQQERRLPPQRAVVYAVFRAGHPVQ